MHTSVVIFLCIFAGAHSWYQDFDGLQYRQQEIREDTGMFTRDGVLVDREDVKRVINILDRKCSCTGLAACECCVEAKLKILFKLKACAGFAFNPKTKALDFTITVDNVVLFKKSISVSKPVKFCHEFSIHGHDAKLCVGLSDISFEKGHTGACIYMEIQASLFHWKQKLGCLYKSTLPKKFALLADDTKSGDYKL